MILNYIIIQKQFHPQYFEDPSIFQMEEESKLIHRNTKKK